MLDPGASGRISCGRERRFEQFTRLGGIPNEPGGGSSPTQSASLSKDVEGALTIWGWGASLDALKLVDKALEGAQKGAEDDRIVAAVRGLFAELRTARSALATSRRRIRGVTSISWKRARRRRIPRSIECATETQRTRRYVATESQRHGEECE